MYLKLSIFTLSFKVMHILIYIKSTGCLKLLDKDSCLVPPGAGQSEQFVPKADQGHFKVQTSSYN